MPRNAEEQLASKQLMPRGISWYSSVISWTRNKRCATTGRSASPHAGFESPSPHAGFESPSPHVGFPNFSDDDVSVLQRL